LNGIGTIINAFVTLSMIVYRDVAAPVASAFEGVNVVPDNVSELLVVDAERPGGGVPEKESRFGFKLASVTPANGTPTVRDCVVGNDVRRTRGAFT
jgi:hypothetical protein